MAIRSAACGCGQLKVTCEGEPVRVSICHCFACQKRTGSVFGVQARFAATGVTVEGRAAEHVRIGDSGGRATFRFCATCGSTVCWELDGLPGFIAVAVGAFADPEFPAPSVAVYEARRHPWGEMASLDVEHFE